VAIGLAVGLTAAWVAMQSLGRMLAGLDSGGAGPVWIAAALVAATAAIACWIPALRAARIDPLRAMRHD
jgi:putative ABC transport system permease protein